MNGPAGHARRIQKYYVLQSRELTVSCPVGAIDKVRRHRYRFPMERTGWKMLRTRSLSQLPGLLVFSAWLAGCDTGTNPVQTRWEADLQPVPPAIVGGQVAAVTQFGRTQASIHITHGEPGSAYAWTINAGTCGSVGETQGGDAAYPVLTAGESGSASADAVLAAVFRPDQAFVARVILQGEGTQETVVACGALQERG